MIIDCDACAVRGPACGDCVVSVLLGGPPVQGEVPAPGEGRVPVELDGAERAALAVLAGCGLVPPLRLVPVEEPATGPEHRNHAEHRHGQRPEHPGEAGEREVS